MARSDRSPGQQQGNTTTLGSQTKIAIVITSILFAVGLVLMLVAIFAPFAVSSKAEGKEPSPRVELKNDLVPIMEIGQTMASACFGGLIGIAGGKRFN